MLKAVTRGEFDLIAVWSIDRLGRSLQHLVETVNELHSVGVDLYIHQQALDTSTPAGKLTFSVSGALAEYERELIRERVKDGIERAKRNGSKLGRPTNLNHSVRAAIFELRARDMSIRHIAASDGVAGYPTLSRKLSQQCATGESGEDEYGDDPRGREKKAGYIKVAHHGLASGENEMPADPCQQSVDDAIAQFSADAASSARMRTASCSVRCGETI